MKHHDSVKFPFYMFCCTFVRTYTTPLAVDQTKQLDVAFVFSGRSCLEIKSHLVQSAHLHDLIHL